jgi:heme exporter protein D
MTHKHKKISLSFFSSYSDFLSIGYYCCDVFNVSFILHWSTFYWFKLVETSMTKDLLNIFASFVIRKKNILINSLNYSILDILHTGFL